MDLRRLMKEYKYKSGLNNEQIAEQFGVTRTTVGRWLNGSVRSIQEDTADKMSKAFGFDVRAILSNDLLQIKKPILGIAKAGYDLFLEENYLGEEEITLDDYQKGDFFLKVTGDSMKDAGIIDGGLVFVRKTTSVNNGDIAVLMIDDEVTIKVFHKDNNGITLKARNPEIPDRFYGYQEIQDLPFIIIGKVIYAKNYL